MNDTVRIITERRSIRNYKPDPIPDDVLQQMVDGALCAPSGRGLQARHLLVLRNLGDIRRLEQALIAASQRPGWDYYKDYVNRSGYSIHFGCAPVFAVASADPDVTRTPEADAALLLGNMFNAAWALGVGSCWINQLCPVGDEPGVRALLHAYGVPDSYRVYGAACFGYAAIGTPRPAARREGSWRVVG